jgi:hypothetical protein
MVNLFRIGKANENSVKDAFESAVAILQPTEADTVREFASWVEAETLISINLRLYIVVEIINGGEHQNTYEWAQETSQLSGRDPETLLRERLGRFYDKRVAFDRAFTAGERFRYGALNAGGAGLPDYGPYCIVLSRKFQEECKRIAYLSGDSLTVCFTRKNTFDENAAKAAIVPHSHRHWLVAKERIGNIPPTPKPNWPELVISGRNYFEAIFIGKVSRNTVNCVRMSQVEYDRMWNLAFANFGHKLEEAERAVTNDFVQLQRAAKEGKVELQVI